MKRIFLAALTLSASQGAFAHVLHEPSISLSSAFFSGLTHPVFGLDHLLMLAAIGLLIAKQSSLGTQLKLMVFAVLSLGLGLALGTAMGGFAGMEIAIATSLLLSGFALCSPIHRDSFWSSAAIAVGLCLLSVHGYAHGVEAVGNVFAFSLGMMVSAALIVTTFSKVGSTVFSHWAAWGIAASSLLVALN
ncbi:putative Urease accessory protein UreJ [Vibrio nigripulchritudo SFn27]|uniref:Putative Urease accessory protein UreJ n=1 Tax=Vibrio nigripulchritudo TaxID=28173 RepID=U4KBW4_9VIBR|nr:HupE/UreJ family protein [Vibrio nigripulchritudo]CCN80814.1 putative Urease accessory protein UreJ [Vibrio nigripulchritudo BLFn1]CCN88070.1 putative Urease accessory protein UreJ [Vibrio nigripulchritudo SFn27]CCN96924.1 putative Urease accessory protein UreJ [Vibrio nigripulchritudo ENn2]CCO43423.1 putative Urease accessory protein UreJ [Vibrio nigripulchritudo SFn135]CCO51672.1 putative Urease accessory protein UreJ [Vibrio nigripulchritudo Wn13]